MPSPRTESNLCQGGGKQQLSPNISQPVRGSWLGKGLMERKSLVHKEHAGLAAGLLGWWQGPALCWLSAHRIN